MIVSVVGDVHLADPKRAPRNRKESYTEEILEKIRFITETSKERGVEAVIYNGDVFDKKGPASNSHALVQATHKAMWDEIPVYITPGNHDVSGSLKTLDSQPLGTLGRTEGITLLDGPAEGLPVYGIPYMEEGEAAKELPKIFRKIENWRKKNKYTSVIISSHLTIFPVGERPPYDYIAADDYASLIVDKNFCYLLANGHIHDIQSESYPIQGNSLIKYVNYGSISRGSLTGENLKKQPVFYTYDTDTEEITVIDIPVKPAEQVFKLDSAGAVKERKASMTNFLDSLQKDAVEITDSRVVVDTARQQGVESTVLDQITELIEWTE